MQPISMSDVLQNAVWITLKTALPILLIAMIVGLIVGILQTATSIQEQTLMFIPKIVAVLLSASFFGPWIFGQINDMARKLLRSWNVSSNDGRAGSHSSISFPCGSS